VVPSASVAKESALEQRLSEFLDAWRVRDSSRLLAMFSTSPQLKLWGSDEFERIVGHDSAREFFPGWIATCPPWTTMTSVHRAAEIAGDIAWAADDVQAAWASGPAGGTTQFRVTTIWHFEMDRWLLVHANVAIPHP
jgi:ketosteroid isomerase-like protein